MKSTTKFNFQRKVYFKSILDVIPLVSQIHQVSFAFHLFTESFPPTLLICVVLVTFQVIEINF